jgi:indole-3-glycerol phosphate synthase
MGILNSIVSAKRERLKDARARVSVNDLRGMISEREHPKDFRMAIHRQPDERIRLIAEIKKASPSGGVIREDFQMESIAQVYEARKVNAVSVLTEEDFFQGSLSYISGAKQILSRPVLRKDFLFDEYQVYESRAHGADAILLIAAILERGQAMEYMHLARELGLSVLFEIHDLRELETALFVDAGIIGINNRNLSTLQVELSTTLKLRKEIPADRIIVSESGIKTREDVRLLESEGIDAMLIGTSFMLSRDIGGKIDELLQ